MKKEKRCEGQIGFRSGHGKNAGRNEVVEEDEKEAKGR